MRVCQFLTSLFQSGQLVHDLRGHTGGVLCLKLVGKHVWSGSADKTIRIWDAQSGRAIKVHFFVTLVSLLFLFCLSLSCSCASLCYSLSL